jgi:hypothetical protein
MNPSRGPDALPLPIYEPIFIIHSYWQSLWQALFSPYDVFYYAQYEAHYLLAMNTGRAYLAVAFLGWSVVLALAGEELSRKWSDPSASVRQRAEAVNRAFTNGTAVSVVVAALGTNYTRCGSSARLWMGPGPEPPNTTWLSYRFGREQVIVGSSAVFGEDPLTGTFTGAGHSIPVRPTVQMTNRISNGQQDGAANGSQPIRSETNSASSAAGFRR